jgi:hypothetical protein
MLTDAGPTIIVGTRTRDTRVSSSLSKIPDGGFSPVRLQGRNTRRGLQSVVKIRLLRKISNLHEPPFGRKA